MYAGMLSEDDEEDDANEDESIEAPDMVVAGVLRGMGMRCRDCDDICDDVYELPGDVSEDNSAAVMSSYVTKLCFHARVDPDKRAVVLVLVLNSGARVEVEEEVEEVDEVEEREEDDEDEDKDVEENCEQEEEGEEGEDDRYPLPSLGDSPMEKNLLPRLLRTGPDREEEDDDDEEKGFLMPKRDSDIMEDSGLGLLCDPGDDCVVGEEGVVPWSCCCCCCCC